ncbi:MAG: hypothetical protein IPG67_14870 [Acidobacteria bacterium]|nr:hypothetical protein [Acidobacteriota bacterium]
MTEFVGDASTGRTSLVLNLLAKVTAEGEVCAVVDSSNSFDPCSAALAGVGSKICSGSAAKATSNGRSRPPISWFRRMASGRSGSISTGCRNRNCEWCRGPTGSATARGSRETPTLFIVTAEDPAAGSASHQSFELERRDTVWGASAGTKRLREFHLDFHSRKHFYGQPGSARIGFDYSDV